MAALLCTLSGTERHMLTLRQQLVRACEVAYRPALGNPQGWDAFCGRRTADALPSVAASLGQHSIPFLTHPVA